MNEDEIHYDDYLLDAVKARRQLEKDPYAPGVTQGGVDPKQIEHIINYLLFKKNFRKLNVTITKEFDNHNLTFTINERK